jgi:hypothetical protein
MSDTMLLEQLDGIINRIICLNGDHVLRRKIFKLHNAALLSREFSGRYWPLIQSGRLQNRQKMSQLMVSE